MTESVQAWWARRQGSKNTSLPYPIGTYRSDWERYPALIRQYHPDLNWSITLTQIPPAADVYLTWQCETGHLFVATPDEQRGRPGRERRRSAWCPECSALAVPPRVTPASLPPAQQKAYACGHPADARLIVSPGPDDSCALCVRLHSAGLTREPLALLLIARQRSRFSLETQPKSIYSWTCRRGHGSFRLSIERIIQGNGCPVCVNARSGADRVDVGDAFVSARAPKPGSAAEAQLRVLLAARLDMDLSTNAVKVRRPFFSHIEVWPDIVLVDLRVAIEYDTIGKHGLEHVGKRESVDKRKDRLLREAGWEVIRIRSGKLLPLGPYDVHTTSVTSRLIDALLDQLRLIRGDLIVNAYLSA